MKKYKIWYGLGGGFGGARDSEIVEVETEEEAIEEAFECACETYSRYAGMYGLQDIEEIAEDNNLNLDDEEDVQVAEEIYCEQRESWLDYRVEEIIEE